jgi:hypothetical protein
MQQGRGGASWGRDGLRGRVQRWCFQGLDVGVDDGQGTSPDMATWDGCALKRLSGA